jgi:hypothetical protein
LADAELIFSAREMLSGSGARARKRQQRDGKSRDKNGPVLRDFL